MPGQNDAGRGPLPPTQPLREEYAALEGVLTGIAALAGRVRAGDAVHPLLFAGALTCLDAFQRCHERKVETVLLPVLRDRQGSIGADVADELAREHEDARHRIEALRRLLAGLRRVSEATCRVAEECASHLRSHRARELGGLFATADRVLTADEVAALCASFRQIDEREIRAGERQALLALADAISPSRQISGSGGPHIGGIVAAHVMRSRPRAVRPGDTLARAAELMDLGAVRELPVVDGEALCGILSRTDIQPHLGHLEWTRVEAAMTSEPVVVTPAQSAAAISRTLVQGCYNAVPVVADEATLVGMVSRSDLLRAVVSDANGDGR